MVNSRELVVAKRGERARDQDDDEGERDPLRRDVAEAGGRREQPEGDEEPDLTEPGDAVVEDGHRPPARDLRIAEDEPGQVDGEQTGAVQARRGAVGESGSGERRDRIEAGHRQADPRERAGGGPADEIADGARRSPARGTPTTTMSARPVVGLLDPGDEADARGRARPGR